MCPQDMDAPEKLKCKLLTPEKLKRNLHKNAQDWHMVKHNIPPLSCDRI